MKKVLFFCLFCFSLLHALSAEQGVPSAGGGEKQPNNRQEGGGKTDRQTDG